MAPMTKKLVVCCDGTWNTPDQMKGGLAAPTNVTKLALAIAPEDSTGMKQLTFYHRGVGTNRRDHLGGGMFGFGLSKGVRDVYRFLVQNFEPGDELFFFGFSRGAFTARSAAGLVRNSGILRPENIGRVNDAYTLYRSRRAKTQPRAIESKLFRLSHSQETRIRCIGVWDTVGALGIPLSGSPLINRINRRTQFHDTALSSTVDAAFHALAIDEKRSAFRPTIWNTSNTPGQIVKQAWFSGVHSNVGGGYCEPELSDVALSWMVDQAKECGLAIREGALGLRPTSGGVDDATAPTEYVNPDPLAELNESRKGFYRVFPPYARPIGATDPDQEFVASTVLERQKAAPAYDPTNLRECLNGTHHVEEVVLPGGR
jgi:uncharacterized protein (DUF2235 family)